VCLSIITSASSLEGVQGRWVGTNSSPGCHLDHCHLSDAEACVLSASGPGKVSVSFRSEKAVVAIKVPS